MIRDSFAITDNISLQKMIENIGEGFDEVMKILRNGVNPHILDLYKFIMGNRIPGN